MNRRPSAAGSRTRTHAKDGSALVFVPGGEFMMGSVDYSNEAPPHSVRLSSFWMSQTPISNSQYRRFRTETHHRLPDFAGDKSYNADEQPIVGVDYADALAYCRWAGGRLPTEAEWEFAARGTDGRVYPWGDDLPDRKRAVYGLVYGKGGKAAPVGSTAGDMSPFGVMDMAGNVLEWCSDWAARYEAHSGGAPIDPVGAPQGMYRIQRGGCWAYQEESLRATTRFFSVPHQKVSYAGFRMVVDVVEADAGEARREQIGF